MLVCRALPLGLASAGLLNIGATEPPQRRGRGAAGGRARVVHHDAQALERRRDAAEADAVRRGQADARVGVAKRLAERGLGLGAVRTHQRSDIAVRVDVVEMQDPKVRQETHGLVSREITPRCETNC